MKIDFQQLLTEAAYLDTKPTEKHNMGTYLGNIKDGHWCGTTSCALGDIGLRQGMSLKSFNSDAAMRGLGVDLKSSNPIWAFLFDSRAFRDSGWVDRRSETPAETAKRIRKFCYYFMRKGEIFAEYNEGLQTGVRKFQGEEQVINQLQEV